MPPKSVVFDCIDFLLKSASSFCWFLSFCLIQFFFISIFCQFLCGTFTTFIKKKKKPNFLSSSCFSLFINFSSTIWGSDVFMWKVKKKLGHFLSARNQQKMVLTTFNRIKKILIIFIIIIFFFSKFSFCVLCCVCFFPPYFDALGRLANVKLHVLP